MESGCLGESDLAGHSYKDIRVVAKSLNYETASDMLYCLYVEEENGFQTIEDKLGFSRTFIRDKLIKMGVTIRGRGGANNLFGAITRKEYNKRMKEFGYANFARNPLHKEHRRIQRDKIRRRIQD